jgi:fido (protein-threonine AMPylation protein)
LEKLIKKYESKKNITVEDIADFHVQFELIHPFEDGSGRVGRMLMVKECLRHGIDPIIIDDKHRDGYYRGIREWKENSSVFMDVVEKVQKRFRDEKEACDAGEYYRPTTGRGAR